MDKKTKGGKREGAGRKPDPSKLVRIKFSIIEKLESKGYTPNQALQLFIDSLVKD